MDQESVDLNAYLALECKLLKKFSSLLKIPFDAPDYSSQVADYFFDKNINFFCDRRLKDGSFIEEPGCEASHSVVDPDCHTSASGRHAAHASRYGKVLHVYPLPDHCRRQSQIQSARYWRAPSGWTKPTLPSADCATTATTNWQMNIRCKSSTA